MKSHLDVVCCNIKYRLSTYNIKLIIQLEEFIDWLPELWGTFQRLTPLNLKLEWKLLTSSFNMRCWIFVWNSSSYLKHTFKTCLRLNHLLTGFHDYILLVYAMIINQSIKKMCYVFYVLRKSQNPLTDWLRKPQETLNRLQWKLTHSFHYGHRRSLRYISSGCDPDPSNTLFFSFTVCFSMWLRLVEQSCSQATWRSGYRRVCNVYSID